MTTATPTIDAARDAIMLHINRYGREPSSIVCSYGTGVALRTEIANVRWSYATGSPASSLTSCAITKSGDCVVVQHTIEVCGMPVITTRDVPNTRQHWTPPRERFVEYDDRDWSWCQYFGIGQFQQRPYFGTMCTEESE